MKYLKLFEQNWWEENDPFGEEIKIEDSFKIGDNVICINNRAIKLFDGSAYLKNGKKYEISQIHGNNIQVNGITIWFNKDRFKKIESVKEQFGEWDPFGEEAIPKNILDWWTEEYKSYTNEEDIDKYTFNNVKKIAVQSKNIDSLKGIEKFKNLNMLLIYDNILENFEGLKNSKELIVISAPNNKITSLRGTENLKKLLVLEIDNNHLTNLNGIENIENLESIRCSENQLTSLEELKKLKKLKHIYCYNNRLSKEYLKEFKKYCDDKKIYLMP